MSLEKETLGIDELLDLADAQRTKREELLKNPRYAFANNLEDPYLVVVHEDQIPLELGAGNLDQKLGSRVLDQIKSLKDICNWTKGSPFFIPSGLPTSRPILVCGAFEEVCVMQQYDKLVQRGYDAYISKEGVLPLSALR